MSIESRYDRVLNLSVSQDKELLITTNYRVSGSRGGNGTGIVPVGVYFLKLLFL